MGTTLFTLASLVIPAVACAAGGSPKGGTYGKGPAPMAGKRLNNFVRELLDLDSPKPQVYPFTIHSPAWIFVRTMEGKAGVQLKLDQVAEPVISYGAGQTGTREAMRYLKAGQHQLKLLGSGVGRLQVRKVPEIRYCSYQYDPWVIAYGPYDWQFLERHILPHVNTVVGQSDEDQRPQANAWRAQAKRWIVEVMAPGLRPRKALSIEETVRQLTEDFRRGPWVDGILIDEYYPSLKFLFQPTIEAIKRIKADPLFSGKEIAPYLAGDPMKLADFIKGAAKLGCKFAIERYNCEQPTEKQARDYLKSRLTDYMRTFGRIIDQPQRHIVVALGIMSGPPESLNTYPHVNYRVFQDMEFHVLANDPQFDGVFGVMGYTAGYAEEETIRWLGKLYRHYCIEGHTTRLTDEPYLLNHLVNPDFAEGTTGWNIKPAEPQTISIRKVRHLGSLEGRFGSGAAGDQCLVMVRSAKAPNVIDQQIKNLQPGALYALRMYSSGLKKASGYRNPTFNDYTTLEIRIDNTTRVPEKSFRHIYLAIHGKPEARMYFNYWVRVFRAKGRTAELTISDWKSPDERFGNIGAQTGINFVEVQRYLEE